MSPHSESHVRKYRSQHTRGPKRGARTSEPGSESATPLVSKFCRGTGDPANELLTRLTNQQRAVYAIRFDMSDCSTGKINFDKGAITRAQAEANLAGTDCAESTTALDPARCNSLAGRRVD